jgi:hypothetical protein
MFFAAVLPLCGLVIPPVMIRKVLALNGKTHPAGRNAPMAVRKK